MSDQTDVANTLVSLIDALIYPNGDSQPSLIGTTVKIYPGWPDPQTLASDLTPTGEPPPPAAALHITVFPTPSERNVTRYPNLAKPLTFNAATYTLGQNGQEITVGGSAPETFFTQNLAIFVNGTPYSFSTSSGQTADEVAAALQALIVAAISGTTVSGAVITLPAAARIGALRVGSSGTTGAEIRRTEKAFQVIVWADTPANRSTLAQAIDPVFSNTPFIAMPDGFAARLHYRSTLDIDSDQKQGIYRRDLFYSVEYATTLIEPDYQIVVEQVNITPVTALDDTGEAESTVYGSTTVLPQGDDDAVGFGFENFTAGEVLFGVAPGHSLSATDTASVAITATPPASIPQTVNLYANGVLIGTATWLVGQTRGVINTGGGYAFNADDFISFQAPNPLDAAFTQFAITYAS